MLGAMAGDIIGSVYEGKTGIAETFTLFSEKSRFTDDTVLTIATAEYLLRGGEPGHYYRKYYHLYPNAGYGPSFKKWAEDIQRGPYNSWGNGSGMRVSPVAYWFDDLSEVLKYAKITAEVTHNHPEGIKGAQAIAAAIFLARQGEAKKEIGKYIEDHFKYNLSESIESMRSWYTFDVSCQGSVPQSIRAFLEGENLEDVIRKAVSLGGDTDTIGCMAGAVGEAYYGMDVKIKEEVEARLPEEFLDIIEEFYIEID